MTSVHIGPDGLTIDGTRVEVHADDLKVDFSTVPPTVRCTIPADAVAIDLPDAMLNVLRDQSREPSLQEEVRLVREMLENIVTAFDPLAPRRAIDEAVSQGKRRERVRLEGAR